MFYLHRETNYSETLKWDEVGGFCLVLFEGESNNRKLQNIFFFFFTDLAEHTEFYDSLQ